MQPIRHSDRSTRSIPIELLSALYLLSYIPYMTLTRWLATIPYPPLGRALTGLEELPAVMLMCGLSTYAFMWASGWWRHAHSHQFLRIRIPRPTRWTLLSGLGAALLLFTVPLSFTFRDVSIPFMQLLMRGDVLIAAPLVDLLFGRRVRWYSWVALGLVALGLAVTIDARGGLHIPPLALVTVVLYTLGYLIRLLAMTRVAKSGDPKASKGYFVEEQIVAIPAAVAALAVLAASGAGAQGNQLYFGFVDVWSGGELIYLAILAALLFGISIFALMILLDPRENTFCVPFERSASVLASLAATYVLAALNWGVPATQAELVGALFLILAITLLALAPRLATRAPATPSPDVST